MPGNSASIYQGATLWAGTPMDMTPYGYITIWCLTAPTTPYLIKVGVDLNGPDDDNGTLPSNISYIGLTASLNTSTGISNVSSISAVGRYSIPGSCWVNLTGGAGGLIYISGNE